MEMSLKREHKRTQKHKGNIDNLMSKVEKAKEQQKEQEATQNSTQEDFVGDNISKLNRPRM